jgi:lipoprotein Spr
MGISRNKFLSFYSLLFLSAVLICSCRPGKEIAKTEKPAEKENTSSSRRLEKKYAELLNVSPGDISNTSLYSFIDEWYGVPYKYGGKNKNGIDCSNFTSTLYRSIYKKELNGTSSSIFKQCRVIPLKDLKEGDLVFFKIEKDDISHIGVYLQNNKFVHATTKKGVMIDDLDEAYYKKYFYKAGRPVNPD